MSTAKRTRQRAADAVASTLPPAKRTKFGIDSTEQPKDLAFLTDERRRAGRTIEAKITNGVKTARIDRVNETKAAVSGENEVADSEDAGAASDAASAISDSSEEPSEESDLEDEDDLQLVGVRPLNGVRKDDEDADMEEADSAPGEETALVLTNGTKHDKEEVDEDTGPSFGDMLQAAHPEVIDVAASFGGFAQSRAVVPTGSSKVLQAPSATSLGTVLTQALRTNDQDLLESCLQTKDLASIKSTIQRLQSPLVATLMQKLAERLHKRPGRAGPLMLWVQWALVTHGGYLASQPRVVRKLRSLRQVVRERANSLQSLIVLKGKLDMLSAQVELRRSIKAQSLYQDESDDDDADVVYVEGMDDDDSSSDEEGDDEVTQKPLAGRKRQAITSKGLSNVNDTDMDGDVPLINGIDDDAAMESMGEEDEDDIETAGLIDDEAEESDLEESVSSEEDESGSASEDEEADGSSSSEDDTIPNIPAARTARPAKRNALIKKR